MLSPEYIRQMQRLVIALKFFVVAMLINCAALILALLMRLSG